MKFGDLEIENFLAIGEGRVNLSDIGLANIAGESDETSADSNGAGKSSIGDALSWCLWGTTARGVSSDEVVNTAAGKGTRVSVPIFDEDNTYRVDRYRKHPKGKNGLNLFRIEDDGTEVDLTKGTAKATQAAIERILGCSEEVFNAAVYSGQEMMPDIPRMTDKQLKLLVEQAAGVDVLSNAYEIAKGRARETSQRHAQAQVDFDRASERHADMVTQIQRSSDESNRWDASQVNVIAALRQQTIDAKTELDVAKKEIDEEGEAQLAADIQACRDKIASVTAERQREQVLLNDVTQAQQVLASVKTKIATEERTATAANQSVVSAEANVERAKNGIGLPCDECGRPMEKDHLAEAISNAQAKLNAQKQDRDKCVEALAKAKAKLPGAEKLVAAAEDALTKHRAGMTDVSGESTRLTNLQREQQIIAAKHAEVTRLRTKVQNLGDRWKNEAAAENPYKKMIEDQNNELLSRAQAVEEAKAALRASKEADDYAQAVADVYAPNGVRAHRLDEATPYLNDRTAHYLGSLADGSIEAFWTTLTETKGRGGELREKFSVTVEKAGSAPSFNALSGGEKRKVRLACALALQDLVATRASKSIDLWIGDEIDDALDDAGLERLMGVLEEKARERGTVLVISHNDIAAYSRKTILVEKQNGRATVTVQ